VLPALPFGTAKGVQTIFFWTVLAFGFISSAAILIYDHIQGKKEMAAMQQVDTTGYRTQV
jgi:hypothetical protein